MNNQLKLSEKRDLLIDYLSDRPWSCPTCGLDDEFMGKQVAPVMIGDVLDKLGVDNFPMVDWINLCSRWQPCGFTKALNEILSGGILVYGHHREQGEYVYLDHFKDFNAQALFDFLFATFESELK